ncbi:DUF885 domain-containing protein [Sphingomonas sp. BN140010]|uniref:DUF885 domain-containing protein n=1 Tax=Sphingomonas arvum TaxID=2992113 RepID=A0ABT3JHV6_9SPHN|nr:DUF885 domain-containing protein [Sphingomonas sp. BN140010]MCW3798668.1 DUF885 domain-containing protein [Sphingomonas sp. BN140010]
MNALTRRQTLGLLASSAATAGCTTATAPSPVSAVAATATGKAPLDEAGAKRLIDTVTDHLLRLSPESATGNNVDKGRYAALRSQLSDRSQAGQERFAATIRNDLGQIDGYDLSALSHSTRTTLEVIKSAYRTGLLGFSQPYGDVAVGGWRNTPYVVIQNVGAYLDTPKFLDTDHLIENAADAEAYVARLAQYPAQLDGETGRMQAAAAKGLIPPGFLIDKAVKQLTQSATDAAKGGGLVESLVRRTREKNISGGWDARTRAIATREVAPALQRQIAELQRQRAQATDAAGMWARPGGDAYYAYALRASTTTNMSPEEIHQLGLRTLDQLHGRMDPILRQLGYTKGTVGQRMQALAKDPKYQFSPGDKGRAEIMAFIQERLGIIRAQLPRGFRTLVKGNLEVKRLPPEEEPGAPGAYGGPGSPDGKIPGKFWINLRTTDLHSRYSLPDLAHHEAIPGHVWQGEYTFHLPLIRTLLAFNAYSEGWALYAEQLADELGVFDDFPVGRLGYLQSIGFRACRLVVDTGIHAKRWTREQGVQFFVERNGSNPLEVASEVDRYCSWPGQACGYEVGHQEINRQRDKAKAALGAAYDLRDFNDAVVLGGNVPMDVLALNVDEYIRQGRA